MAGDWGSLQVVDQYEDGKAKSAAEALAKISGRPEASRWAVAEGLIEKDGGQILGELQKQNKVRLYLVSTAPRMLAEIDKPEDLDAALAKLKKVDPTGGQTRLAASLRP